MPWEVRSLCEMEGPVFSRRGLKELAAEAVPLAIKKEIK